MQSTSTKINNFAEFRILFRWEGIYDLILSLSSPLLPLPVSKTGCKNCSGEWSLLTKDLKGSHVEKIALKLI